MFSMCRSVSARLSLVLALLLSQAGSANAQSGGVTLRITLTAESVEVLRAWRRAQGLDPPDAAADERVRQIAARRAAERAQAESPDAARLRRMARTVELVDQPTVEDGY